MMRSRPRPTKAREQKQQNKSKPTAKYQNAKSQQLQRQQRNMHKAAKASAAAARRISPRHGLSKPSSSAPPKLPSTIKVPHQTAPKRTISTSTRRVQTPSSSSVPNAFNLTPPKFTPFPQKQQKRPISIAVPSESLNNKLTSAQLRQSRLIRTQFAKIPTIGNAFGMVSTIADTPESLLTQSSRGLITNNHSTVGSAAATTVKASALVSRVTSGLTPISLPHHSNIASNPIDNVPFFMPIRGMAMQKAKEGKDAKGSKKKGGFAEIDPGEEAFNAAGDVKKNLRNWLEHILQSKPDIHPLPEAAQQNEELFVKECQTRFAQRLDQRSRYEQAKIILKQRAITQLPGELKKSALAHDPSLWSMRVMTPFSDPPRKRWLHDHYRIPYKATQHEIDEEDFLKKKYARL